MPNKKPSSKDALQVISANDYLTALRGEEPTRRDSYAKRPLRLAETFGLKFPKKPLAVMKEMGLYDGPVTPGIRDLVIDICSGKVHSAVVAASRGSGKSQTASFIEFFLVFIKKYDALNLGGSEMQADQVYQYLLGYMGSDPYWQSLIDGDSLRERTYTKDEAWVRVLTASPKSVRSPHAGGIKKDGRMAGGLLVIDEEAEADPGIVAAALPTVNTARPSVVIRSSTFHNNEGSFADLMDNHKEMGFKLFHWDLFDVAEKCACKDKCESPEPCFKDDHIVEYIDAETNEPKTKLLHKAYCGGRARFADGWVLMSEIETMWRRMKRNHGLWEVEAMGLRPPTAGFVIRDRVAYQENTVSVNAESLYKPGFPVTFGVDWGTINAGFVAWQEQENDTHVLLMADVIQEAGPSQIISYILAQARKYGNDLTDVRGDMGGGGNYMNISLTEDHYLPTTGINFQTEKEASVIAWNIYNEAGKIKYPAELEDFHRQTKAWKRKNGKIQKGDDHLCDATVCYFSKFTTRLGISTSKPIARSFDSAADIPSSASLGARSSKRDRSPGNTSQARIRTIGSGRAGRRRQR